MKKVLFILFFIFIGIIGANAETKIPVKLVQIYDGDTIQVQTKFNKKLVIRLKGIDCYETSVINRTYKQAYENKMTIEEIVAKGNEEKQFLVKLFEENKDKKLYLVKYGKDCYKRTLGVIYLDNINVNEYMLNTGNAMEYYFKNEY